MLKSPIHFYFYRIDLCEGKTTQQNRVPHNYPKVNKSIDNYPKVLFQFACDFGLFYHLFDLIYLLIDQIDRLIDQILDQFNSFSIN